MPQGGGSGGEKCKEKETKGDKRIEIADWKLTRLGTTKGGQTVKGRSRAVSISVLGD